MRSLKSGFFVTSKQLSTHRVRWVSTSHFQFRKVTGMFGQKPLKADVGKVCGKEA